MKKLIKIAAILFPLLSGCSRAPSGIEPSLADKGIEVSPETFILKYRQLAMESQTKFFVSTNGTTYQYPIFSYNTMLKAKTYQGYLTLSNGKNVEEYAQQENIFHINPFANNFYASTLQKQYKSDIENTSSEVRTSSVDYYQNNASSKYEVYGENIANTLYYVDITGHAYRSYPNKNLNDFAIQQCGISVYMSVVFNMYIPSSTDYSYYMNGNILTYEQNNTLVNSGQISYSIVQFSFNDSLSVKGIGRTTLQNGTVQKVYMDLEMYKTNESVKRVDYSDFELIL